MRRWLCIAAFSLVLLAVPVWAQRHGGGGGGAHFASHGSFAAHASVGHPSSIGRPSIGRSAGAFRGGSFGRNSGVRIRTGNLYHRGFYGRRGYYPYAGYYPYGYYSWYVDPLYDTDDQDSYASEYNPSPVPYRDDSGTQQSLDQLNNKMDRLQQDVEARNRAHPDPNPRRRWFSATSTWRKCIITRSPAERSGCLTNRLRKRFRLPNSIFQPL